MALSNSGKAMLTLIRNSLNIGDTFKTRDLGIGSAASLRTLLTDGYIMDLGGSPKTYKVLNTQEQITIKTDFAFYSISEWQLQTKMSYQELCDYLIRKYGQPNGNYFLTSTCKTPNDRIKRSNENLEIHHIKENIAIDLSKTDRATLHSWEYQTAKYLLYANPYEHLLLHMLIAYEYEPQEGIDNGVGIGGVLNWIAPKLLLSNNNFLHLNIEHIIQEYEQVLKNRPIYQLIQNNRKLYFLGKCLSEISEDDNTYPYPNDDISNSENFIETIHKRRDRLALAEAFRTGAVSIPKK